MTDVAGRLRSVVTYPHPVLKQKCSPVSFPLMGAQAVQIPQLAADMITTVKDGDGLGLAAPQVRSPAVTHSPLSRARARTTSTARFAVQ